ncbi:putative late blight resistance protein homolog R1B-14 isoform X2 [Salvia miltiorrhiza]|nr:putative late blight resistance protein homolog R1B-14 isoform X2 [Salvia miltiorrhiza]
MSNVAMEAEDVIELYMTEKIHFNIRYTHWVAELRRIKFIFQLRRVRDQMDSIAGEVVQIKNSIIIKDAQLDGYVGASSSSSQGAEAGKTNMVGLNVDLMEIMGRLCGDSRELQILPITGMGGIGKTTLARNAYDHPFSMEHFQIRVWVTISQDYSEQRILSNLLDSLKEFDRERGNISMAVKVYQILVGRRFLIVIDDIWSAKVLDDIRKLFPDNNNGSRILLTTRLADVAAYANSSMPSHELHLMDSDQSWNLLREKVFGRQDSVAPELETIGREIARSCGGLPLAVVVVAGILSTVSMTRTLWKEIAKNVKSYILATTDGQVEKILSLSYNHLPHHLRPCFLYMGGFPEDHEIKVKNLIRLWIAEGFVKRPVASKSFEEIAEEYLEDLIRRSLIIVSNNKSNGKTKNCRLHDLLRDLCIKKSQEEKFLVHVKGRKLLTSMKDERRIRISQSDETESFANVFSSTIRTILYFKYELVSFGSFRLLRVLDVLRVGFQSRFLPDQFFELYHLRYIAFCYVGHIPRAISNLQCLQTLIVKNTFDLPREIWNMPQLRHLITLGYWCELDELNVATLALENLQTLGTVRNLKCSLSIVNMIPNLKKLSLICSWDFEALLLHNLMHLRRLENLNLVLGSSYGYTGVPNLVLPSSLKKLALIGWGRNGHHLKIVCPLPNLEVLKLRKFDFKEQEWTVRDHDFPKLRFLLIDDSNLKQWNTDGSHFPLLEHLRIHYCRRLSEIPDSVGEIPTLKLVEVKRCEKSLADSVKVIQEEQQNYGDDFFEVRCINC